MKEELGPGREEEKKEKKKLVKFSLATCGGDCDVTTYLHSEVTTYSHMPWCEVRTFWKILNLPFHGAKFFRQCFFGCGTCCWFIRNSCTMNFPIYTRVLIKTQLPKPASGKPKAASCMMSNLRILYRITKCILSIFPVTAFVLYKQLTITTSRIWILSISEKTSAHRKIAFSFPVCPYCKKTKMNDDIL